MRVRWTRPALADLAEIHDYVATDNPATARRIIRQIRKEADILSEHPVIGRAGRVPGTRELVTGRLPYVIAYRIGTLEIAVVAVIHTSRNWPGVLPG